MSAILLNVFDKTKPSCRGIIHVGSHHGQEIGLYVAHITPNVIAYEPLAGNFAQLKDAWGDTVDCRNKAAGNFAGQVEMFVESANGGKSSSILKPKKHLDQYPDITFDSKETCEIVRLDDDIGNKLGFDTLVLDVQGYELEVLKGARDLLSHSIEHIVCEVNCEELYENCALVGDLDTYLRELSFKRVLTFWGGVSWGNALYERMPA
jgi:FkbM family methyltransferase